MYAPLRFIPGNVDEREKAWGAAAAAAFFSCGADRRVSTSLASATRSNEVGRFKEHLLRMRHLTLARRSACASSRPHQRRSKRSSPRKPADVVPQLSQSNGDLCRQKRQAKRWIGGASTTGARYRRITTKALRTMIVSASSAFRALRGRRRWHVVKLPRAFANGR
jgi:hypothetical protein